MWHRRQYPQFDCPRSRPSSRCRQRAPRGRLEIAARRLPSAVRLHFGDGTCLPDSYGSFDLIMQFLVFSSILDDPLLSSLASRIWNLLRPGGIILSYDMALGNPFNPDVRGIPLRKLKTLFPGGSLLRGV